MLFRVYSKFTAFHRDRFPNLLNHCVVSFLFCRLCCSVYTEVHLRKTSTSVWTFWDILVLPTRSSTIYSVCWYNSSCHWRLWSLRTVSSSLQYPENPKNSEVSIIIYCLSRNIQPRFIIALSLSSSFGDWHLYLFIMIF